MSSRQIIKIAGLRVAKSLGLFALARRATADCARILCYHGTWRAGGPFEGDAMFIRPSTFARRLELLKELGYCVVSLDEIADDHAQHKPRSGPLVAITIDDGWHGTYADMLPHLKRMKMPATLYCDTANLEMGAPMAHVMADYICRLANRSGDEEELTADWHAAKDLSQPMSARLAAVRRLAQRLGLDIEPLLASQTFNYMSPGHLADAAAQGLDVQLHTHNHTLHDMSAEAIAHEVELNRDSLARHLTCPPERFRHFCYPSGRVKPEAAKRLADLGLRTSTTLECRIASRSDHPHLLPRLIDGDNISEIEFEAELSGFMSLLWRVLRRTRDGGAEVYVGDSAGLLAAPATR
ncbi:MAG: polysaccharide deacetylase family protein [Hyphomicrobiaceae bacterium]